MKILNKMMHNIDSYSIKIKIKKKKRKKKKKVAIRFIRRKCHMSDTLQ